ncbi:prolyl oligopeptidase family serine peptidase [Nocardia nova]|nr:prolyl oligopeptidase family serine peptidase [Nocardia nova]
MITGRRPRNGRAATAGRSSMRHAAVLLFVAAAVAACGGGGSAPSDPYLWLEELDSPRVHAWVDQQNQRTLDVLEHDSRYPDNLAQATALAKSSDRIAMPHFLDSATVDNFWQDGDHKHGIWRETSVADYETPQPRWTTLIDLDELSRTEGKNWVWKGAECDPVAHRRCLVQLSDGGEDAVTVREFDRTTKQFVPDGFVVPHGKTEVTYSDENTVLVSREWQPGETTVSGYPYVVKRWQRGRPLDTATEVVRGDRTDQGSTAPTVLDNGAGRRIDVVVRARTFFEHDTDLITPTGPVPTALPPKSDLAGFIGNHILVSLDQEWRIGGATYPAGALVSVDADRLLADPQHPAVTPVYVPGPSQSIGAVSTTRDHAVVTSLDDVRGRATVYTPQPDGSWSGAPIALPDNATIVPGSADSTGDRAFLTVTSFLDPTTLWSLDTTTAAARQVKSTPPQFDSSRYVVEQRKATSPDGTAVPYFVVHAADMKYDGTNPTLLYAYGGFAASETPTYSGTLGRLWLDHGGVYVLANIRGGGEFGPAWHEAARTVHRQRAFDDFAAVGKDLVARDITTPRHLGIQGGSNGGLLMGVEFVQHPDMWNAVDIQVPLLDMMRYEKIAAGASWVDEYGSVDDPAQRAFLESISPYAQLRRGVTYPEPFVWTTSKDDRVGPQHARKFAARLAEYGVPYLFYEAGAGGHGAGADREEQAHTSALEFTYLMRQLMPPPPAR